MKQLIAPAIIGLSAFAAGFGAANVGRLDPPPLPPSCCPQCSTMTMSACREECHRRCSGAALQACLRFCEGQPPQAALAR